MFRHKHWKIAYRQARRLVVGILGGTVVLVGVALLVLPGPAFLVIPLGLGILSLEFAWASRWLARLKQGAVAIQNRSTKPSRTGDPGSDQR